MGGCQNATGWSVLVWCPENPGRSPGVHDAVPQRNRGADFHLAAEGDLVGEGLVHHSPPLATPGVHRPPRCTRPAPSSTSGVVRGVDPAHCAVPHLDGRPTGARRWEPAGAHPTRSPSCRSRPNSIMPVVGSAEQCLGELVRRTGSTGVPRAEVARSERGGGAEVGDPARGRGRGRTRCPYARRGLRAGLDRHARRRHCCRPRSRPLPPRSAPGGRWRVGTVTARMMGSSVGSARSPPCPPGGTHAVGEVGRQPARRTGGCPARRGRLPVGGHHACTARPSSHGGRG